MSRGDSSSTNRITERESVPAWSCSLLLYHFIFFLHFSEVPGEMRYYDRLEFVKWGYNESWGKEESSRRRGCDHTLHPNGNNLWKKAGWWTRFQVGTSILPWHSGKRRIYFDRSKVDRNLFVPINLTNIFKKCITDQWSEGLISGK